MDTYLHNHGTADVNKVIEAAFISEERIPNPQDVGQVELLRQEQS